MYHFTSNHSTNLIIDISGARVHIYTPCHLTNPLKAEDLVKSLCKKDCVHRDTKLNFFITSSVDMRT